MSSILLQNYSGYSLLKSTCSIEALVNRAEELQYTTIALTDERFLYGAYSFYHLCKKKGIKPILGVHAFVEKDSTVFEMLLYATNEEGFQNVMKISSAMGISEDGFIRYEHLLRFKKGVCSVLLGIEKMLNQNVLVEELQNNFEHFFVGISSSLKKEEKDKWYVELRNQNLNGIALHPVRYINKEDGFSYDCIRALDQGVILSVNDQTDMYEEYFLEKEEFHSIFEDYPEFLENTIVLSKLIEFEWKTTDNKLPTFPVPSGYTSATYLRKLCEEGLKARYELVTERETERLDYELKTIESMGYSDYFLIVYDFMKYAHDKGMIAGPGRGSAAGSLVSYALFITNVDPLHYDLMFERFLNKDRISMPDIDIDFPDYRRDEMIQYVREKYGELHVAQIITFGTLGAKAVIRDVCRVLGYSPKESDTFAKKIPNRLGITLKDAIIESKELKEFVESQEKNKLAFSISKKLEGLPRHTSVHAAGVILSGEKLTEHIPVQKGAHGELLTQFDGSTIEKLGLLKMDFLGLRNLSLLERTFSLIEKKRKMKIKVEQIPLEDKEVFSLLSKGETTGIFQLESQGMRSVLRRLKPSTFDDIVAVNALYRPGPMDNIPEYIAVKHGEKEIHYIHEDLLPILQSTSGVIIYQEQIMKIVSLFAGFSLSQADIVRRAVSKKNRDVLEAQRTAFVNGSIAKGYAQKTANDIYDLIVRFADYGFPKSHAVAYSTIAMWLAYLKTHYPLEFYTCLLSMNISNDEKLSSIIYEAKKQHIVVSLPRINKSYLIFSIYENKILYGLQGIKGVGIVTAKEIVEERKSGEFQDLFDLCMRVPSLNRKTLEALIGSGALDDFGKDRSILLASIEVALRHGELIRPKNKNQIDFFPTTTFIPKPKMIVVPPLREEQKLELEREFIGFYLSAHPFSYYESELIPFQMKKILDVRETLPNGTFHVGGIVTEFQIRRTKRHELMCTFTIGDETSELNCVMFPKEYQQFGEYIEKGCLLVVEGRVDNKRGYVQLVASKTYSKEAWQHFLENSKNKLFLRITENISSTFQKRIQDLLSHNRGNTRVVLFYEGEGKYVELSVSHWINENEQLIKTLQNILGVDNVVLRKG